MRVVSPASDAALARQLFLDAPIPAVLVDSAGVVRGMNNAFNTLHGLSAHELIGRSIGDLVVDTDGGSIMQLRAETESVPVEVFTAKARLADGSAGVYMQLVDRRPQSERERELQDLAYHDHMTGLLNRRGFDAAASQILEIARREQRELTMMFIDIRGLKSINDSHGHATGDRVIERAGAVLQSVFRDADAVARYGGDEFCVLGLTNSEDSAADLHRRLLDAAAQCLVDTDHGTVQLRVTAGVVHAPARDVPSLSSLMDRADEAMYQQRP